MTYHEPYPMKKGPSPYAEINREPNRLDQVQVESDDRHDPWFYFDILWHRRFLIAGATVLAMAIATVATVVMPRAYRAEATIFLTPPTYATTLRPEMLSIEAYARLAESDYILTMVDVELQKKRPDLFPGGSTAPAAHHASYSASLVASREPQKPYLPLVSLSAEASLPEKAKVAANTWADIVVREEGKFSEVGKTNAANFILAEYPKVESTLAQNEAELVSVQRRQGQEMSDLKAQTGVSLKKVQLENVEKLVVTLETALATAKSDANRLKPIVAEFERELKATPPVVTISKAITDDALWNAQTQGTSKPDALANTKLLTQEPNPVYAEVGKKLAEVRVQYNSLEPQIASLERQVADARREAGSVRAALLDAERRVAELGREHARHESALERAVDASKKSFDKLAEKIGDARISQSESTSDLKLGSYAEVPEKPSGPRRVFVIGGAGLVAFLGSSILLFGFAVIRRHLSTAPAAGRI